MKNKNKQKGFLDWVFKKWYFWVFFILAVFIQGRRALEGGGLFITILASFVGTLFWIWICYLIINLCKKIYKKNFK